MALRHMHKTYAKRGARDASWDTNAHPQQQTKLSQQTDTGPRLHYSAATGRSQLSSSPSQPGTRPAHRLSCTLSTPPHFPSLPRSGTQAHHEAAANFSPPHFPSLPRSGIHATPCNGWRTPCDTGSRHDLKIISARAHRWNRFPPHFPSLPRSGAPHSTRAHTHTGRP